MVDLLRRRLPRSAIAWFTGAAFTAIAAVMVARAHVDRLEATRPDVGHPTVVVVAAADLTRGTALDDAVLSVADVPSTLVPPGALTSADQAAGRVLAADLAQGEILTRTRLSGAGSGPIAALVPAGLRAFVLPAGPPAGTLRRGDEVDVLATYGANAERPYTETVASALEVLDVIEGAPQAVSGSGAPVGPPIVVLADPLTVERLARAASLALLSIAIVGDDGSSANGTYAEPDGSVEVQPTNGPSP